MLHLLTIVLVICKVMELINWHWLLVFLPSICAVVIPMILLLITFVIAAMSACN